MIKKEEAQKQVDQAKAESEKFDGNVEQLQKNIQNIKYNQERLGLKKWAYKIYKIVLLRHGESKWNLENKFTGLKDVPLTSEGINEALNAGELLQKNQNRTISQKLL